MLVSINWIRAVPAALLLLPPVALCHGERIHHRAIVRSWAAYWRRTLALPHHTFDLVRAAAGAWLLAGAFETGGPGTGLARHAPLLAQGVILVVALCLQSLICREREAANAPFAFVLGLLAGYLAALLPGWTGATVGGFALVPAIVIAMGVRSPALFFPLLGVALPIAGTLFKSREFVPALTILGTAILVPWLLTLLFPRHFVVAYRSAGHAEPPRKA